MEYFLLLRPKTMSTRRTMIPKRSRAITPPTAPKTMARSESDSPSIAAVPVGPGAVVVVLGFWSVVVFGSSALVVVVVATAESIEVASPGGAVVGNIVPSVV